MGGVEAALPPIEAFLVAGAAIYLDCYQAARKQVVRVPPQVLRARGVLILAIAVGVLAVGIFVYTNRQLARGVGSLNPLDTILSLKISNPYVRAAYVGFLTLAIIRSKLLDLKSAPIGLDYIYTEGRLRALIPAFSDWSAWRNEFISKNKAAAFAYANYFTDLDGQLESASKLEGETGDTARALSEVRRIKPGDPADPVTWDLYYRTLTRLALDTLGPAPFKRMVGFS